MAKKKVDREEVFRSMPINKAMWTLCIPNVLSMLTGVLYNLVDMYYIGRIGDPNQVAAVSLCGPLFMTLMGFLLGSTVGIVTVMMVFMLGPVITLIKKFLQKHLGFN